MNIIVLEGPDGAGKSTLAEKFKEVGFKVIPFGVPPKTAQRSEEAMFHFFFDTLYDHRAYPGVVFDRLHLSDRIYAPLMRGGTPMTERAEALVERFLEAIAAQVVICLPPRQVAYTNWAARPGREYVKDAGIFQQIYAGYAQLLFDEKRNHSFLWYDYTRTHAGSFVNALREWQGFPLPHGVVGSQSPRFLFVGERPGPGDGPDLPFMSTRNSSGWLFDAIRDAGYPEREVAFVNAFGKLGTPCDLTVLITYLAGRGLRRVIALGDEAGLAVLNGLQHESVKDFNWEGIRHPQYAKRFHAKDRARYVAQLKKIRRDTK